MGESGVLILDTSPRADVVYGASLDGFSYDFYVAAVDLAAGDGLGVDDRFS